MAEEYSYEKLDENYNLKYLPMNDFDGSITGHIVFGIKAWFDENPEERKRLGWIKHIRKDTRKIEYNHQTQFLSQTTRQIDEYTIEDVYHVMDKSEEMMRLEELLNRNSGGVGIVFYGAENDTEGDGFLWG